MICLLRKNVFAICLFIFLFPVLSGIGLAMGTRPPGTPTNPPEEPPALSTNEKVPILMIHGLYGRSTAWYTMKKRLKSAGYNSSQLFAIDMVDNKMTCSENHLDQIQNKVAEISATTGAKRIDLIGHSRGGFNIYSYMLYRNGVDTVRNLITIGGANNQICAGFGSKPSDPTPGTETLYTSIYSTSDGIVPTSWSIIKGADNIEVSGVNHMTMLENTEIFEYVLDALAGSGLNIDSGVRY